MIRKMTKYSFLLLNAETDKFLEDLQKTGLVDITRSRKPVDSQTAELFARSESLRMLIDRILKDDFTRNPEYVELQKSLSTARRRYQEVLPWGKFDKERIALLEENGYRMHFYCIAKKKFNPQWEQDYPLEVVSDDGSTVRFVIVAPTIEPDLPVKEIAAPDESADILGLEVKSLEDRIKSLEEQMSGEKERIPELKKERSECESRLQKMLAASSRESAAEDTLDILTGFALTDDDDVVKNELDKLGVFYVAEPATKEDNPPIRLKNNWFARNFETLTGMYGMPVYDEFDPTPILAPFFLLFWAFCMGDAGYGILLMGVAFMLRKVDLLGLKKHWRLVLTLGVGSTVIGFFLATFFGINLTEVSWIPEGLKKCMIAGKIELGGTGYDVSMIAALAVGVFHICLALVVKAIGLTKRFGLSKAVSTWGWILLIIGGISVAAFSLAGVMDSTVTKWAVIIIGIVSALGIFVFNTPGRNPLVNIGAGLWDTYGMTTGLLGDVLSYVRLYALGLAGGMLGAAFNSLGGMILGSDPTWQWLFFALVVILGHALNFAMACLGAFVHPLRLTFVEYFKNSGYEGRGTEFNPLKEEIIQ
ncbi:MAG: ATPase V [Bacteroidales bacterium]|nr:ATPase V [Candidatus Cacconaster merdequi]